MIKQLIAEARERALELSGPKVSVAARGFSDALLKGFRRDGLAVIAEVKPRSPTTFNADLAPADAALRAQEYERLGASAVSVLTETKHFGGSIEHLHAVREAVSIPVLRKDFIVKEAQMDEVECDAILLIARGIGKMLPVMVDAAADRGIEALVEVHDESELSAALTTPAAIIGVNNRDLDTLEVDNGTAPRLLPKASGLGRVLVAESGISDVKQARRSREAGAHAVLVGNALMREPCLITTLLEVGR